MRSLIPHTAAMNIPMSGIYAYRSAIDCAPAWISPITGTSVPRNHSHPTPRYLHRRQPHIIATLMHTNSAAAIPTRRPGKYDRGCGYKTDSPDGHIILPRYATYDTIAFSIRIPIGNPVIVPRSRCSLSVTTPSTAARSKKGTFSRTRPDSFLPPASDAPAFEGSHSCVPF